MPPIDHHCQAKSVSDETGLSWEAIVGVEYSVRSIAGKEREPVGQRPNQGKVDPAWSTGWVFSIWATGTDRQQSTLDPIEKQHR